MALSWRKKVSPISNLRPLSVWNSDSQLELKVGFELESEYWVTMVYFEFWFWCFGMGLQRNEKGDRVLGVRVIMAGICLVGLWLILAGFNTALCGTRVASLF